jgi:hypothetical protein
VDLRRVGRWQWLTGLAGLVLLVSLWLPWYGASGLTANAWESFAYIDLLLALTALGAIALVVVNAMAPAAAVPKTVAGWLRWLALVAALLAIYRVLKMPNADVTLTGGSMEVTRKAGAFIGALAAVAVTVFSWLSARDARFPGPLRMHPDKETLPPPTAEPSRRDVR